MKKGVRILGKAVVFRDLRVWGEAHKLTIGIYKITEKFPEREKFGLVSQMRRAAVSVPANVAEGFAKKGKKDKCNFYNISQGSLEELKYYLILAEDLGYLSSKEELLEIAESVSRMLIRLIESVGNS